MYILKLVWAVDIYEGIYTNVNYTDTVFLVHCSPSNKDSHVEVQVPVSKVKDILCSKKVQHYMSALIWLTVINFSDS